MFTQKVNKMIRTSVPSYKYRSIIGFVYQYDMSNRIFLCVFD